MRVLRLLAIAVSLPLSCGSFVLTAQDAPSRPTEPGTASPQVTPASQAPRQVQQPDVRLDSKPHTDIDSTVDSPPASMDLGSGATAAMDLGLGANVEIDLGHDIVPTTPPGMVGRSVPGNPRMVYYSLPAYAEGELSAEDSAVLDARRPDLMHAAASRGFDLKQAGWSYRQDVCPTSQGADSADNFLLLHFLRQDGEDRTSAFAALVPRVAGQPVRVISVARRSPAKRGEPLRNKIDRKVVDDALPEPLLYSELQPEHSWMAASACIAALSGASPRIPNEPFLTEDITTAPAPTLELKLNGQRKTIFTDRVSDERYVVWNEHVSQLGRVLKAKPKQVLIAARPVTNPPLPNPVTISDIPQPRVREMPLPPSPLSGNKQ